MSEFLKALFSRAGSGADAWGRASRPAVDGVLGKWLPATDADGRDWATDADWARLEQAPIRARSMLRLGALVILVLVVWAGFAKIDEVTKGEGKVIPSSQLQIVQSVDGGVVEEIRVREGQIVNAGDLLLRVDPTRFVSSLRENQAEYLSLLVRTERLKAVSMGRPFVPPPEALEKVPEIVEQERRLYHSSLESLEAQLAIARQQLSQRNQELKEVQVGRDQAARSYELAARELAVTKPLASSGAVSEVELLRLERDVNRFRGERDQASAQLVRLQSAISEASRKVEEVELNFRNQIRGELSEASGKLGSLSEGSTALADRVKHADVRSPVRGTIKRLLVNTVGGVVQPGKEVVEVVPLDDALLLEAKIRPKDIAFLRPGQPAIVKFTAYDFAIYGGLEATVEQIGADTVTDDEGNAFYLIRVRTKEKGIGDAMPIIPGLVAEVDILTGKKSILSYLLKPVLRAKANALTER